MNHKIAIIQARTGSSRLPDKILLKILGKEILLLLVDRVVASQYIDKIIIATTTNQEDDKVVDLIENYHQKVSIFRGNEIDVLDRYYQAALQYSTTISKDFDIIRITSDCPLIDPKIIDLQVEEFDQKEVDYLSSRIHKRTWPHGMELEIFTFDALRIAWQNATEPFEHEHVTPYIYKSYPEKFSLYEYRYKNDLSHYRFTIDYKEDYNFVKTIFEKLYPKNSLFSMNDILQLLKNEPEFLNLIHQKLIPQSYNED